MIRILVLSSLLVSVQALSLCVTKETANLRTKPTTKSDKSWQVIKFMPLKPLKKRGRWYRVQDVDGDTHWIFETLVTKRYKCAVVKVKKTNLRTGPSRSAPKSQIYPSATKYETFKYLTRKGGWAQVMDIDGDKYWIFRKNIWVY